MPRSHPIALSELAWWKSANNIRVRVADSSQPPRKVVTAIFKIHDK
jgi:hypothetical protein